MTIYAATTNAGKLREFAACASVEGVTVLPLPGLRDMPEPAEDAATFLGNAELKAVAYSLCAPGLLVFADDSGLCVDALDGAPGVRSARFAADQGWIDPGPGVPELASGPRVSREPQARETHTDPGADGSTSGHAGIPQSQTVNDRNNACLVDLLHRREAAGSAAQFRCALALARNGEVLLRAEGEVRGTILIENRGTGGFGYDPLFLVPEFGRTLAELTPAQKWSVSHRGRAFRALLQELTSSKP